MLVIHQDYANIFARFLSCSLGHKESRVVQGFSRTYPVKRVCVEREVGFLPIWFFTGLKADLLNCKNVALLLSLISTLRNKMRSSEAQLFILKSIFNLCILNSWTQPSWQKLQGWHKSTPLSPSSYMCFVRAETSSQRTQVLPYKYSLPVHQKMEKSLMDNHEQACPVEIFLPNLCQPDVGYILKQAGLYSPQGFVTV